MSRLRPGRRTFATLAILLLLAVAGSDFFIAEFWLSHPMLTAIISALVVVVLSVAVIGVSPQIGCDPVIPSGVEMLFHRLGSGTSGAE